MAATKRIFREWQHPRASNGRFARKGSPEWVRAAAEKFRNADAGLKAGTSAPGHPGRPRISRGAKAERAFAAHDASVTTGLGRQPVQGPAAPKAKRPSTFELGPKSKSASGADAPALKKLAAPGARKDMTPPAPTPSLRVGTRLEDNMSTADEIGQRYAKADAAIKARKARQAAAEDLAVRERQGGTGVSNILGISGKQAWGQLLAGPQKEAPKPKAARTTAEDAADRQKVADRTAATLGGGAPKRANVFDNPEFANSTGRPAPRKQVPRGAKEWRIEHENNKQREAALTALAGGEPTPAERERRRQERLMGGAGSAVAAAMKDIKPLRKVDTPRDSGQGGGMPTTTATAAPALSDEQRGNYDKLLGNGPGEGLVKHKQSRQIVEQMEAHGWTLSGNAPEVSLMSFKAPDGREIGVQFLVGEHNAKPRFFTGGASRGQTISYKAALAHVVTPTHEGVGKPSPFGEARRLGIDVKQSDRTMRPIEQAQTELQASLGGSYTYSDREVADEKLTKVTGDLRRAAATNREQADSRAKYNRGFMSGDGEDANSGLLRTRADQFEKVAAALEQGHADRKAYLAEKDRRAGLPLDVRPTPRTGPAKPAKKAAPAAPKPAMEQASDAIAEQRGLPTGDAKLAKLSDDQVRNGIAMRGNQSPEGKALQAEADRRGFGQAPEPKASSADRAPNAVGDASLGADATPAQIDVIKDISGSAKASLDAGTNPATAYHNMDRGTLLVLARQAKIPVRGKSHDDIAAALSAKDAENRAARAARKAAALNPASTGDRSSSQHEVHTPTAPVAGRRFDAETEHHAKSLVNALRDNPGFNLGGGLGGKQARPSMDMLDAAAQQLNIDVPAGWRTSQGKVAAQYRDRLGDMITEHARGKAGPARPKAEAAGTAAPDLSDPAVARAQRLLDHVKTGKSVFFKAGDQWMVMGPSDKLEPGHKVTVHKADGSTSDVIVGAVKSDRTVQGTAARTVTFRQAPPVAPAPAAPPAAPAAARREVSPGERQALYDRYSEASDLVATLPGDNPQDRKEQAAHRELNAARQALTDAGLPLQRPAERRFASRKTPEAASGPAITPLDRARIKAATEDYAAANHGGALNLSRDDTARYVTEGHLRELEKRYGTSTVQEAVRAHIEAHPDVLTGPKDGGRGKEAARKAASAEVASEALQHMKSGRYDDALAAIDRGERDNPDFTTGSGVGWDGMRERVATKRKEAGAINLEKARAAATEQRVEVLRDSKEPKDNAAKIKAVADGRMDHADLYRTAMAGPSGQRSPVLAGRIRHTPDNPSGEFRVTDRDGKLAGWVTSTVHNGEQKYAVHSENYDGETRLEGWADTIAHAADVLTNGETAASTGGTLDARRVSGRLFERYKGRDKTVAELDREALDREIRQHRDALASPSITPGIRARHEASLAKLEAEKRGELDTSRDKSHSGGADKTPTTEANMSNPTPRQMPYTTGRRVEVQVQNFDKPGFPMEWMPGTVDEHRLDDNGRIDMRVKLDKGGFAGRQIIGKQGGNKNVRPLESSTTAAKATPGEPQLGVTESSKGRTTTVTLPDGTTATRTSKTMTYTHAVVGTTDNRARARDYRARADQKERYAAAAEQWIADGADVSKLKAYPASVGSVSDRKAGRVRMDYYLPGFEPVKVTSRRTKFGGGVSYYESQNGAPLVHSEHLKSDPAGTLTWPEYVSSTREKDYKDGGEVFHTGAAAADWKVRSARKAAQAARKHAEGNRADADKLDAGPEFSYHVPRWSQRADTAFGSIGSPEVNQPNTNYQVITVGGVAKHDMKPAKVVPTAEEKAATAETRKTAEAARNAEDRRKFLDRVTGKIEQDIAEGNDPTQSLSYTEAGLRQLAKDVGAKIPRQPRSEYGTPRPLDREQAKRLIVEAVRERLGKA